MKAQVFAGDCADFLTSQPEPRTLDLTFLDPPFNQAKAYEHHDDDMPEAAYWAWMARICRLIHERTSQGGAIYFMQREKNAEQVLSCLRETGWTLQNLIIWKKLTSAVPSTVRYGKAYQIIAYATKGARPRVFHRLRINPPLPANYRFERKNGMFVTDIWDDIRELTSGYFAGDEAIRRANGERAHKQQAPIALLLRILLTSTRPGDAIFDPFAGTGTTLIVGQQLGRAAYGVEIDPANVALIQDRLDTLRAADSLAPYQQDYAFTENLNAIWGAAVTNGHHDDVLDLPLFRQTD
ncbi:MAG: site-specific DNA-methyltransferase [Anaerolineae bacterium]|nr:site-specific DNA-methyltransferase [Anaerolineae bacterium]